MLRPLALLALLAALGAAAPSLAQTPSKIANPLFRPLAAEPSVFLAFAQKAPKAGACEVLSPDPGFVEEMLLDVSSIGAPGGKKYEQRVALVVGNGAYQSVKPLANPPNDATAMAKMFRALGFTVYRAVDAGERALDECFQKFKSDLEARDAAGAKANLALFFYAGHGVQLASTADNEKRNYMLAVDAAVDAATGKARGFRQVDKVLSEMRAHSRQAVFLYDACRNAPYGEGAVKEADEQSVRAWNAGAAPIDAEESDRASQAGLFIAYATSPGKTADDAWGAAGSAHSPFTEALLRNLPAPGVLFEEALLKAYYSIGVLTNWRQTPWTSSSLTAEVRLNGVLEAAQVKVEASERAARALAAARLGLRGAGVAAALKGLPRRWIDTEEAAAFSDGRAHLFSLMRRPEATLRGHNDSIQSASISPDKSRIVSAAEDVRVWDAATGIQLQRFAYDVRLAAYSSDGRQIFMGGQLVPADAPPGDEIEARLDDPNLHLDYRVFAYSPDSRKGITSSEKRIKDNIVDAVEIWDMRTGKLLRTLEGAREVDSAAFSPDGRRVVTGQAQPGEVRLWDAETGKAVAVFAAAAGKEVTDAAYFGDGARAIVRDLENPADVAVWRVGAGAETVSLQDVAKGFGRFEVKYAFSPDGRLVAGAAAQGVSFWDAATGEKLSEGGDVASPGQSISIDWMSFSPDGGLVVTAAPDRTARLWSAGRPLRLRAKDASSGVLNIAFSGDGRRVAARQGDGVRLFDSHDGGELAAVPARFVDSIYLSANGRRVAMSDYDGGSLWNAETGALIAEFDGRVYGFSPDGARGLRASPAGAAIWDAASGKTQLTLKGGEGAALKHAAFSPDGRRVVTAWSDCVSLISDVKDGRTIQALRWKPPELEPGFSIACNSSEHAQFSGDGRRILTYGYGSGTIWDAVTGAELSKIGPEEDITHAILSPDGRFVFVSTSEQAGKIFDADTGRPVATLAARVSKAEGFSSDGRRALGLGDSKAAVFDALTGAKLEDFDADVAAFDRDGTRIAAGGFIGPATVRDAGLYGPELLEDAYNLLTDDLRAEVERERVRYWEVDPTLLQ